jgi:hypothetical protein
MKLDPGMPPSVDPDAVNRHDGQVIGGANQNDPAD